MNKKYWFILLFLISIFIRVPNLNRPLSKHHEFNTAFFLIPMEIWEDEGIINHGFIPSYSYTNLNDKNINNPIGIQEANFEGTYYYLSFPSFSYLLPYFTFKILNVKASVLSLQVFSLILHFILCWILFFLLTLFFKQESAFYGVLLYLFSPAPLWFHGNGYTHHVLAIVLFVATIFCLVKYLKNFKNKFLVGFGLLFFFLILTEWISILLGFTMFFLMLFSKKINIQTRKRTIVVLCLSVFLAFLILFIQYENHIGIEHYIDYQINRFKQRSTIVNKSNTVFDSVFAWVKWNAISFGGYLLIILILTFTKFKKIKSSILLDKEKRLFIIVLIPIILHHLVFMEFVYVHDYSVLIDGVFWTVFLTFLLSKIELKKQTLNTVTLLAIIISSAVYFAINKPGEIGQNGDPYNIYKNIGENINQSIQPDETVFLTGFSATVNRNNPQIIYYAKRNFKAIKNERGAKDFLINNHRKKGRIYFLENGEVIKEKKIDVQ